MNVKDLQLKDHLLDRKKLNERFAEAGVTGNKNQASKSSVES